MAVLEKIIKGNAPLGIVMEDDFTFFDPEQASLQLKRAIHLSVEANVVLLACSHPHVTGWGAFNASDDRAASTVLSQYDLTGQGECAVETLSDHFVPVLDCQTTSSGYMITKSLRADASGSLQGSRGASRQRSIKSRFGSQHVLEVSPGA